MCNFLKSKLPGHKLDPQPFVGLSVSDIFARLRASGITVINEDDICFTTLRRQTPPPVLQQLAYEPHSSSLHITGISDGLRDARVECFIEGMAALATLLHTQGEGADGILLSLLPMNAIDLEAETPTTANIICAIRRYEGNVSIVFALNIPREWIRKKEPCTVIGFKEQPL